MAPLTFRQDHRPRSRRPPQAQYVKLFLMAMVLLMLLAVIVNPGILYHLGLPQEEPRPTRPVPPPGGYPVQIFLQTRPATRSDTSASTRSADAEPRDGAPSDRPETQPVALPLGIDRSILNDVEDLQDLEAGPYFEALKAVRALPSAAFTQAGLPEVEMPVLLDEDGPRRFRGRLITVRGNLRRLERRPLGENVSGLHHVYEAQLRYSAGAFYTAVVIDPPGKDVVVGRDVSVTGIFYKLWVYGDREGTLRQTPLIMGRRIEPIQPPYPEQYRVPIALGTIAGILVVGVVTLGIILYRRGDRRFDRTFRLSHDDVHLDDLDLPEPADDLRGPAQGPASEEPDDGRDES